MKNLLIEPLKYYAQAKLKHTENLNARFDEMVRASGIDVLKNRETVVKYKAKLGEIDKISAKITKFKIIFWLLFAAAAISVTAAIVILSNPPKDAALFVCLVIGLLLVLPTIFCIIAFVKIRPVIKSTESIRAKLDDEARAIRAVAEGQLSALNSLFCESDTHELIEKTMPEIKFYKSYTREHEARLIDKYDYIDLTDDETSILNSLSGELLGNPFLYERYLEHRMVNETYTGSITIHWTTTVRDKNGARTVHHSQVLTASVVKPKPNYTVMTHLGYGCDAAPDLSFSRTESDTDELSEGALARRIKRGEKKLKKRVERELNNGGSFQEMSNTEFDVLFAAHNRSHEVQFRLMYTPLAQSNTVALLRSKEGYGDDFNFIKQGKYNIIKSLHAQSFPMQTDPSRFKSYDIDESRRSFVSFGEEYFKAVFFDIAPLLAIPAYHESSEDLPAEREFSSNLTEYEHETLANAIGTRHFAHPDTDTEAILKARFVSKSDDSDVVSVTAHSYKKIPHTDIISVWGRDGRYHGVPVNWIEYVPLTATRKITLRKSDIPDGDAYLHGISARLCD